MDWCLKKLSGPRNSSFRPVQPRMLAKPVSSPVVRVTVLTRFSFSAISRSNWGIGNSTPGEVESRCFSRLTFSTSEEKVLEAPFFREDAVGVISPSECWFPSTPFGGRLDASNEMVRPRWMIFSVVLVKKFHNPEPGLLGLDRRLTRAAIGRMGTGAGCGATGATGAIDGYRSLMPESRSRTSSKPRDRTVNVPMLSTETIASNMAGESTPRTAKEPPTTVILVLSGIPAELG